MKKLSILVPAFNEEKTIETILKNLQIQDFRKKGFEKEIIVIDDGSKDKTSDIISKFDVKLLKHDKNRGKGAAIKTGLKHCSGDYILIQDADLEYDPKDIPKLLKEVEMGYKVVYGSRFKGKIENMSKLHYFGNKFLSFVTRLLYKTDITDLESCYKLFQKDIIDSISLNSERFGFEPEITAKILKKNIEIKEVPIKYKGREKEEKKISWKDGLQCFEILVKYRLAG